MNDARLQKFIEHTVHDAGSPGQLERFCFWYETTSKYHFAKCYAKFGSELGHSNMIQAQIHRVHPTGVSECRNQWKNRIVLATTLKSSLNHFHRQIRRALALVKNQFKFNSRTCIKFGCERFAPFSRIVHMRTYRLPNFSPHRIHRKRSI